MNKKGEMLSAMLVLSTNAQMGQFDRSGKPSILHPLKVMHYLKTDDEELQCMALGHALFEDTKVNSNDLRKVGISERVIKTIMCLTRMPGESDDEYESKVISNIDAIRVKKQDLRHTNDIRRIHGLKPEEISRTDRHHQFYLKVCDAEQQFGLKGTFNTTGRSLTQKGEMLSKMLVICTNAHVGQFDKADKPYILHPLKVMHYLQTEDEELQCIALGHDLFEDTKVSAQDLRNAGISERVIQGIMCLTKMPGESYEEYQLKVMSNLDSIKVKKQDLRHNLDVRRLHGLTQKDFQRNEKYQTFYVRICEAERQFGLQGSFDMGM